jgi:hypothetical protein
VQVATLARNFQSKHIINSIEEHEPIRRGAKLAIISYTLPLPIEHVEISIIVVSTRVEVLEEPIIPKFIPLIILETRVGTEVTLIDNITHAFNVLKTP